MQTRDNNMYFIFKVDAEIAEFWEKKTIDKCAYLKII